MNATSQLIPSALTIHKTSAGVNKFNQPAAFKLLKDGVNVPSNRLFDPVLMKDFNSLPQDVKGELIRSWLLTSTLIVKNEDGKMLGDRIVFSDGECSVTFIVNKAFQKEYGIVADLIPENFNLELSADGKHAVVSELREADAKLIKPVAAGTLGIANDSTLWVPAENTLDAKPGEKRRFSVPEGQVAALAGRGGDDLYWRFCVDVLPSGPRGVLEIVSGKDGLQKQIEQTLTDMQANKNNPEKLRELNAHLDELLRKQ